MRVENISLLFKLKHFTFNMNYMLLIILTNFSKQRGISILDLNTSSSPGNIIFWTFWFSHNSSEQHMQKNTQEYNRKTPREAVDRALASLFFVVVA